MLQHGAAQHNVAAHRPCNAQSPAINARWQSRTDLDTLQPVACCNFLCTALLLVVNRCNGLVRWLQLVKQGEAGTSGPGPIIDDDDVTHLDLAQLVSTPSAHSVDTRSNRRCSAVLNGTQQCPTALKGTQQYARGMARTARCTTECGGSSPPQAI